MIKTIVYRPIAVTIFFALVVGIGLYSSLSLPVDLYPQINPPVLLVRTSYPVAGPREVEESISIPLERVFGNVPNITEIRSISYSESSNVILSFEWGYDINAAANDVRDRLENIKNILPDDAGAPQIFKFDPNQLPILELKVFGERSAEELREIAEDRIIPYLERISGVALVSLSGGRERIVTVEVPRNRLEAHNLTFGTLAQAIRSQNNRFSAGSISNRNIEYQISTEGEIKDIPSLEQIVIHSGPPPLLIRDVGEVGFNYQDPEDFLYINGEPGILLEIQKQSGTNSVTVVNLILNSLDDIQSTLPPGITLNVSYDSTEIIRNTIRQVAGSALYGGLLATLILLFFLRNIRATLIIAFSIPVSVIVTLMLMFFADLTLNIMSLTGLAVGIGMLVDNSIVILENIYRYRERGSRLRNAAILGTKEMIKPITASTLTTICVFAPIVAFKSQLEILGVLFSDLAFTVVISLTVSWVTAVLLVPTLASSWLALNVHSSTHTKPRLTTSFLSKISHSIALFLEHVTHVYQQLLIWSLGHKVIVITALVLILGGAAAAIPILGFEFLPSQEEDSVVVSVTMPVGTTLEITQEVVSQLEEYVKANIEGYDDLITSIGGTSFLGNSRSHTGSLTIILPPFNNRVEEVREIQSVIRSFFSNIPSARFSFRQGGGGGRGLGFNTSPIDVVVSANNYEEAREVAQQVYDILKEHPQVLEPEIDVDEGLPELEIYINRERAYTLGLNIAHIGEEVRAHLSGVSAGLLRTESKDYDIRLISAQPNRDDILDLNDIYVVSSYGTRVSLSNFVDIRRSTTPVEINREAQQRTIHVTASLAPGAEITEVEPEVFSHIQSRIPITGGLLITSSGEYREIQQYFRQFLVIMLIAVALVFGIIAAQFESFRDPFIIFCSIPFLLVGVVVIYIIGDGAFSAFGAVGLVMLGGIVVNNGIILVDRINLLLKRGESLKESHIQGSVSRLRPIFMTTFTTILGLLPIALFQGENATLVQPIAKTVVGGLAFNMIISLLLVPILSLIIRARPKTKQ